MRWFTNSSLSPWYCGKQKSENAPLLLALMLLIGAICIVQVAIGPEQSDRRNV